MSLADLALVYALIGVACAIAIYVSEPGPRVRAAAQAAVALPLWPIWAPLALTRGRRDRPGAGAPTAPSTREGGDAARAAEALFEAADACVGTPFAGLLSRDAAERIAGEIARASARRAEAAAMLAREGFDLAAAEARVVALEREPGSPRALATARLHLTNVRRLDALRCRDDSALAELADLAQALRTQLLLARLAGSECLEAGDIVAEVWARIEGLDAANGERGETPSPSP